jgi:hypothetical protein
MGHRIFVYFENGCYVTTECADFSKELAELVTQYGAPVLVEYRAPGERIWIPFQSARGDGSNE